MRYYEIRAKPKYGLGMMTIGETTKEVLDIIKIYLDEGYTITLKPRGDQ